jgi:hypothetical protein
VTIDKEPPSFKDESETCNYEVRCEMLSNSTIFIPCLPRMRTGIYVAIVTNNPILLHRASRLDVCKATNVFTSSIIKDGREL